MAHINEKECEACGVDPKVAARIAARLERVARDAKKHGMLIFGGSGSGTLRGLDFPSGGNMTGRLVVAEINGGSWSGGDGAYCEDEDGLIRGE